MAQEKKWTQTWNLITNANKIAALACAAADQHEIERNYKITRDFHLSHFYRRFSVKQWQIMVVFWFFFFPISILYSAPDFDGKMCAFLLFLSSRFQSIFRIVSFCVRIDTDWDNIFVLISIFYSVRSFVASMCVSWARTNVEHYKKKCYLLSLFSWCGKFVCSHIPCELKLKCDFIVLIPQSNVKYGRN